MKNSGLPSLVWLLLVLTLLLGHGAARAALLTFDIDESTADTVGPFNLIFTTGEVVLCDGGIQGRRVGCNRDVAISDIVTFTAERMVGSFFQMKSANERNDTDGLGETPPPADVDAILKTVTDNVVYLVEHDGVIVYTPDVGEPGFIRLSANTSQFNITSDAPEPGAALLFVLGFTILLGFRRGACCRLR